MRIAIFLDDICIARLGKGMKHIFLFDADNEVVTAVGEELTSINDINYICLWLLGKGVKCLYSKTFGMQEAVILQKAGIKVYPLEEIKNHPLLRALLIKYGV